LAARNRPRGAHSTLGRDELSSTRPDEPLTVILSREDGEGSPAQIRRGSLAGDDTPPLHPRSLRCVSAVDHHRLPRDAARLLARQEKGVVGNLLRRKEALD